MKLYRIPSTFYTKVLDPEARTVSNQEIDPDRTLIDTLRASRVKLLISTLQLPNSPILRNVCFTEAVTFRQLQGPNRRGRPRRHWLKTASEDCWQGLAADITVPGRDQGFSYPTDMLRMERCAKSSTVNSIMLQWWSMVGYY